MTAVFRASFPAYTAAAFARVTGTDSWGVEDVSGTMGFESPDEVAGVEGQGGRVLERSGGDADFTITAEVGSDIQRTRYLTGSGSRVVGQWVYPKAQQGQFDVTAEQALRSLRAQGLDQPH